METKMENRTKRKSMFHESFHRAVQAIEQMETKTMETKTKNRTMVRDRADIPRHFHEAIEDLPAEMYAGALEAVLDYAFYGEEPHFDTGRTEGAVAKMAFILMRGHMDSGTGK